MPATPPRFPVRFGEVFPMGCGFPYPAAEFEGVTIIPYAVRHGRAADSFRATGLRAPTVGRVGMAGDSGETASKSAAA